MISIQHPGKPVYFITSSFQRETCFLGQFKLNFTMGSTVIVLSWETSYLVGVLMFHCNSTIPKV